MFEINDAASIRVITEIGPNKVSVIIVDDFYKNPDEIRNLALKTKPITKEENPQLNGGVHKKRIYLETDDVRNNLKDTYSNLVSVPNIWKMKKQDKLFNNAWDSTNFLCNSMNESEITGGCPHTDGDACHFASVIYLNTPEECAGGTGLFSYDGGMTSFDGMRFCPQEDNGDVDDWISESRTPHWVLEYTIPMKYNRMILYEGNVFHSQIFKRGMFDNYDRLNQSLFM